MQQRRWTTQDSSFEAVSVSATSTGTTNYDVIILGTDYVFYLKLKGFTVISNIVTFIAILKATMDILLQILKIKERKQERSNFEQNVFHEKIVSVAHF